MCPRYVDDQLGDTTPDELGDHGHEIAHVILPAGVHPDHMLEVLGPAAARGGKGADPGDGVERPSPDVGHRGGPHPPGAVLDDPLVGPFGETADQDRYVVRRHRMEQRVRGQRVEYAVERRGRALPASTNQSHRLVEASAAVRRVETDDGELLGQPPGADAQGMSPVDENG